MTREETIEELEILLSRISDAKGSEQGYYSFSDGYYVEALNMAIEAIKEQPKRGKWIIEIDTDEEMLRCSECDNRVIKKWYRLAVGTDANKCPYCGARMETEQ